MKKPEDTVLLIDCDSTIFYGNHYPELGPPVPYALEALKYLSDRGFKIILHTIRCDGKLTKQKDTITPAYEFLISHGIKIYSINYYPNQLSFSGSRKTYGHICIDDINLGCPLMTDDFSKEPFVDWKEVLRILKDKFNLE